MDYLKYDWCSYGDIDKSNTLEGYKKPYIVMHQALNKTKRDIVYSLCQYGMGDVWKWGGSTEVGGNCWRTSGDIIDTWSSLSHNGFDVMRKSMVQHSCPGHYNDPDMLVVGRVGWGSSQHPTRLTPDEQLTHITLWSMAASPLLIGCDMTQMDKFTHDLLTNTEVLDIDQDPLVLPVQCVANDGTVEVWARKLYDGTVAVACFNKGKTAQKAGISWSDLSKVAGMPANINGKQPVRDLWKRQNLGQMARYQTTLPRHGTVLLKVGTPQAI